MFYKWLNNAHMALFPPTCVLCGARGEGKRDICAGCRSDLPTLARVCPRCAMPLSNTPANAVCGTCLNTPPAFDRTIALYAYAPPVDYMIHQLKFAGKLHLAPVLGTLLAEHTGSLAAPDCVMPVPLHRSRLRERGFNQAMELARPLADALGIPFDTRTCYRVRPTAAQSGMSKQGRRTNIKDAFAVNGPVQTRHVAIIDDVMTTGSTVNELARVLKMNGAYEVTVIVVARAI